MTIEFWKKNLSRRLTKSGTLVVVVVDPFDLSKIDVIKSTGIAARIDLQVGLENDILNYLNFIVWNQGNQRRRI